MNAVPVHNLAVRARNLTAATGGNPLARPDYREPLRAGAITAAKHRLLAAVAAPADVVDQLTPHPIRQWPAVNPTAAATIAARTGKSGA